MSNARRGRQLSSVSGNSRPPRKAAPRGYRCDEEAHAAAHAGALSALDARLGLASSTSDLYDLALRTVRRAHPSACTVLLEVDAERLASCRSDVVLTSGRSRQLVDRVAAESLPLGTDDHYAIRHGRRDGIDPVETLLESRLELSGLVVGRVRLDGAVIALLVLHLAPGLQLDRDRDFVDGVAERVSARMDAAMDLFWASVTGEATHPMEVS